jgi:hypothetical protein
MLITRTWKQREGGNCFSLFNFAQFAQAKHRESISTLLLELSAPF